jgi:prepilin-type N-terminal cleavage/methylation domain-containing protein
MLYAPDIKCEEKMIKRQEGFTLVELLITMVIFVFTIAAASSIFVPLLTQFKQQSKIAETQIEGLVGLETLRRDIEQAGFGLPWVIPTSVTIATYSEASSGTTSPLPAPDLYNDAPEPPRAIFSGNNITGLRGSDYLVIKATSIANNDAAMRWTYVVATGSGNRIIQAWDPPRENMINNYRVIALIPTRGENSQRILVTDAADNTKYSIQFSDPFPAAFSPITLNDLYLVYGVDPDTNLRMPFNRADYYIRRVATSTPARCAKGALPADNTGVLVKSLINQADGVRGAGTPLLDCVADMQVLFRLDRDGDGTAEEETDVLTKVVGAATADLTAQEIRQQLKEVRVYILTHEGQKDTTFTYCVNPPSCSGTTIAVGEFGLEHNYNMTLITDWQHYRWKVYRIVVKPNNLG